MTGNVKYKTAVERYWNKRRQAWTWKVHKPGTNAFLLLGDSEIAVLYEQIGEAIGGER